MKRLLPVVAAFAVAGCSTDDRSAGGGGFGGETLTGQVVDTLGRGVSGARLLLRSSRSLDGQVLAEGRADDSGRYVLTGLPRVPMRMQVAGRVGADSVMALLSVDPGRVEAPRVVGRLVERRLRIVDEEGRPVAASVQAYALGLVASTDDSGRLRLSGWPSSDLWVRVTPREGRAGFDLLLPGNAADDVVAAPGWLLDDFEGGEPRTRLGELQGGGWWYGVSRGEDPSRPSQNLTIDVSRRYDSLDPRSGRRSLHARFDFDSDPQRYGLVGCMLGPLPDVTSDWSMVDSVEFWARGTIRVRFEVVATDDGGGKHSFLKTFDPSGSWSRFVIRAEELAPLVAGESWAALSDRALLLQFYVFDDGEFWLDDIRVHARELP